MAWPIIELTEEIRLRIQKAKDEGGFDTKDIFVGDFRQIRKEIDYPITVIAPTDIQIEPECMPHGTVDQSIIRIFYTVGKLSDNNLKLYDSGKTSGGYVQVGKMLNYIEKHRTTGNVDLTLNGTTNSLLRIRVTPDYSQDDLIIFRIEISVKTNEYIRGQR